MLAGLMLAGLMLVNVLELVAAFLIRLHTIGRGDLLTKPEPVWTSRFPEKLFPFPQVDYLFG